MNILLSNFVPCLLLIRVCKGVGVDFGSPFDQVIIELQVIISPLMFVGTTMDVFS